MKQRKSNVKLILVAVSGAVLISSFFLLKGRNSKQTTPPDSAMIMVAKIDMNSGETLDDQKYEWKEATTGQITNDTVTKNQKELLHELEGAVVKGDIEKGNVIKVSGLIKTGGKSALSTIIRKGKRAVAVPFNKMENPPALIAPGDIVDIILPKKVKDSNPGDASYVAQTILRGLRVLAVDSALQKSEVDANLAGAKNTNRIMTLEVSAEQAEELGASIRDGELIVSVQSVFSKEDENTIPKKNEKEVIKVEPDHHVVKVIRGNETKEITIQG